jgi:hypothetical protein
MNGDELEQALRAFTRRRRFRSFLVELTSGDRLHVRHPEAIDRYGELFYYRGPDHGNRLFSAAQVCQLLDLPS